MIGYTGRAQRFALGPDNGIGRWNDDPDLLAITKCIHVDYSKINKPAAYRRDFLLGVDFRFDVLPLFGFRVLALAVGGMIGSST